MAEKTTKERIMDAALHLFEEKGFHAVTVDKIVKESKTSKGGFYHNFKSKDELLYTIHDSFITYVLDKAHEAYENFDTPTERLYETVKSFVMMFDMYRAHVTVFYQESLYLSPDYFDEIKKKRDEYKEMMFKVVREGIDSGEFRQELPVPIMSMAIFGMINWTYKWYKSTGRYSIEEIAEIYADLVLHSTLTKEALEKEEYARFFLKTKQHTQQINQ
ncbi:TetR/AcrR family transcriptional regulator [Desertibacillus haloalkaliphilus]|uniref:TetR/AcrR family transcriptional regulator n=1 Tax=Desertibacillus haloalkaliphilus TaxID=1328930 RepID=UPI001C25D99F|nr:TetR/AcrR family transcriptional regulator [Desertibacillus haloalkaliphilus]MBU8904991.1 TetR/AcrR family transcriptional regulator [Desertibacillus haloalkaliphilus]